MELSVIICTYNPKPAVLGKVLNALEQQTLSRHLWELIVIDNCSKPSLSHIVDLSWHPAGRIIVEKEPGLSHARIAGIQNSRTELIVFADDDNVLEKNYLEKAFQFYQSHPRVGCFGGRSLPVFETEPPAWLEKTGINLGCQDYGHEVYISDYASATGKLDAYPEKAPIGTGMVIQKKAFLQYLKEAAGSAERMKLGRKGTSLSSGEDNDIILSIVKKGFEIAYVPGLVVHHLISSNRYTKEYLERMAFESNRTWMKVLKIHGINSHKKIPKWAVMMLKLRSYIRHKAWKSPLTSIQWKSTCGAYEGRSEF